MMVPPPRAGLLVSSAPYLHCIPRPGDEIYLSGVVGRPGAGTSRLPDVGTSWEDDSCKLSWGTSWEGPSMMVPPPRAGVLVSSAPYLHCIPRPGHEIHLSGVLETLSWRRDILGGQLQIICAIHRHRRHLERRIDGHVGGQSRDLEERVHVYVVRIRCGIRELCGNAKLSYVSPLPTR